MSNANHWRHGETCEANALATLRRDPSSKPACMCGLDEAIARAHGPTLEDLLRYVDSDDGKHDCYLRTDLRWHEGAPSSRAEWFERLVRGLAEGKLHRDFRNFLDCEQFQKTGTRDDACASCGAPKREHLSEPPHDHFTNGCEGFRLAQKVP